MTTTLPTFTNGGYECMFGNEHNNFCDMADMKSKDDMIFCVEKFPSRTLNMMSVMRSHKMLTDVILEVEKKTFHAHKVVLSAASPYFKAMFTGGLKECDMSRIPLQAVCSTAMDKIISFMYTGHIRVTENTVCALLTAAAMFQVPDVINSCCSFLEKQLDPTNAIGIATFADQQGCRQLQKIANDYIDRFFNNVCQEDEFLNLNEFELISLIKRDQLNVEHERDVYNAVINWIRHDAENRSSKLECIMYAVRCQLLTPKFIKEQIKKCEVLKRVPACREYLTKVFQDLTLHKQISVKVRTPNTNRIIFVAGGFFKHSLDVVEGYNVDEDCWIILPNLRIPRSGLGAAFVKGKFYAVGGRNNTPHSSYDSDWVDKYDVVTEKWLPSSPMSVPRNRLGVAVMDEFMYAVGGSSGSEYHDTVERYDLEDDRWSLIENMHEKRLGVGVVVVNRLLYAIGGFNGMDRLKSVECYHPENKQWHFVPSMDVGRSGSGVAAINQYIYVVGGFDGNRQLSSVERYDTENKLWENMATLKVARSALSLTALDGLLYAMGGFDGTQFLSIVEIYDPKTNEWREGKPLPSGRSGHASAVIFQPSLNLETDKYLECIRNRRENGSGNGGGVGRGGESSINGPTPMSM